MPVDLFVGKSNVQTNVYVIKVNEKHHKDDQVKFIDFSNDGYTRTNRRKSSSNLRDTDRAKERYEELVNLVRFGKSKLNIFTNKEYYENTIDPQNGADWNQTAPTDTKPTLQDLKNITSDYLAWEVSNFIKQQNIDDGDMDILLNKKFKKVKWGEFILGDLFDIQNTLSFNKDKLVIGSEYDYVTRTSQNQGILQETGFVNTENINSAGNWSLGLLQMDFFYRRKPWYAGQFVRKVIPKINLSKRSIIYFTALLNKQKQNLLSVLVRDVDKTFLNAKVKLPILEDGQINYEYIDSYVAKLEDERIKVLESYLSDKKKEIQKDS